MVRTTTTSEQTDKATAQWRRAWYLLPFYARAAITVFCVVADEDLAKIVLKN